MSKQKLRERLDNSVNAGSMADIAFLLLIFFLVTTTIIDDQGILVKLPPWDPNTKPPKIPERNLCKININYSDELTFRGERLQIPKLKEKVKQFIANPEDHPMKAISPKKAVISLINDRETNYTVYIAVYDQIKQAYKELRDEMAQRKFGKPFDSCTKLQRKEISIEIPLILSEAEPTDFSQSNKLNL